MATTVIGENTPGTTSGCIAWAALVLGTFILMHPYPGIVHDGVLYLGQALARLSPDIYEQDVFFRFYERAKSRGGTTTVMEGDHVVHLSQTDELARLLEEAL